MTKFVVIHRTLSEDHILQINSQDPETGGWSSEAGSAYMKAERGDIADAFAMGMYQTVAVVTADRLDDVFGLTNHIDWNWTTHRAVEKLATARNPRSTSVGDLVVDLSTLQLHVCAMFGWGTIEGGTADMIRSMIEGDLESNGFHQELKAAVEGARA